MRPFAGADVVPVHDGDISHDAGREDQGFLRVAAGDVIAVHDRHGCPVLRRAVAVVVPVHDGDGLAAALDATRVGVHRHEIARPDDVHAVPVGVPGRDDLSGCGCRGCFRSLVGTHERAPQRLVVRARLRGLLLARLLHVPLVAADEVGRPARLVGPPVRFGERQYDGEHRHGVAEPRPAVHVRNHDPSPKFHLDFDLLAQTCPGEPSDSGHISESRKYTIIYPYLSIGGGIRYL